ncbi:helix-turn-helix domain-containing protein [Gammaproteobacteria bacterium AB-CW1]|uniref:Helix-turn-helix domain-containing protein n=1 Tax=Natronospira elongata TaxID=3110268 RepID=A0AAP6JGC9_9GAMM|nr:helix-turn-helix domain-containing protein [Gammaproteobacteria bacterium AB-CW1]
MSADLDSELQQACARVGASLRLGRKRRFPGDTQGDFARRVGVSRYTYQKMERGEPGVAMGSYLAAASLLGILDQVVASFTPKRPPLFGDKP